MSNFEGLTLYFKPSCPYCQKVVRYMDENQIALDMCDILESSNRDDLVKIGGKNQVPCLVINGEAMYESNDIIAYLKESLD